MDENSGQNTFEGPEITDDEIKAIIVGLREKNLKEASDSDSDSDSNSDSSPIPYESNPSDIPSDPFTGTWLVMMFFFLAAVYIAITEPFI